MPSTIYQYEHNTAPTISDAYFAQSFVDNSVHKGSSRKARFVTELGGQSFFGEENFS
jgi:hypothetical protein